MKTTYKRRNFFIKKGLQGKYAFSYFIFVMIGVIFFTFIFSMLSMNTLSIVYDDYDLQIGTTPLILLGKILASQWIFMVVFAMLFVVIISILFTHRIAGPMYRFEQAFNAMINGNIGYRIKLRKKDEGKELADKINRFNDMLSEKLKATNRISLADAIAIAEANVRNVELVTCDHHEFDTLVKEDKMVAYWIR